MCIRDRACIEFGRNVVGLDGAHSSEMVEDSPHPVIDILPEQKEVEDLGGTMRLGAYPCVLQPGSKAADAYGKLEISERHRHRWEFNEDYKDQFQAAGMLFSGSSPDGRLVEVIEIPSHPFFVASQFHPEFKSKPFDPHPLFEAFVRAAGKRSQGVEPASSEE